MPRNRQTRDKALNSRRILIQQGWQELFHLNLGLFDRDPVPQTRHDRLAISHSKPFQFHTRERDRQKHVGRLSVQLAAAGRKVEIRGHDSDNRVRPTIQRDHLPDNRRISAVCTSPESVAHDQDAFSLAAFFFSDRPADGGRDAEHAEQFR
jgi:hypothetical protein